MTPAPTLITYTCMNYETENVLRGAKVLQCLHNARGLVCGVKRKFKKNSLGKSFGKVSCFKTATRMKYIHIAIMFTVEMKIYTKISGRLFVMEQRANKNIF